MKSLRRALALVVVAAACGGDDEVVAPRIDAAPPAGDAASPDASTANPADAGPGVDAAPAADAAPGPDGTPGGDGAAPGPDGAPEPDAAAPGPDATPMAATCPVAGTPALALEPVIGGLSNPVMALWPPGDDRAFLVEQSGYVRILDGGGLRATPFLNLDAIVRSGGEEGLLGVAFHPGYATNRRLFVYYTNNAGNIEIAEYRAAAADANVVDLDTRVPLLTIAHPGHANHNGGWLAFGPDGFLYAGTGDGGGGGDPDETGQDLDELRGKVLRLDVDGAPPYQPAAGNPFIDADGADEIWAYGLRNPWRASFDRTTGDLYLADVGQNQWEEVNVWPAGAPAGANFGWDDYEASECYDPDVKPCDPAGKTFPIHAYAHGGESKSVTGGYVYRGACMPGHHGTYFYADYYGEVFSLRWDGASGSTEHQRRPALDRFGISAFAEDPDGELYVLGHIDGTLYKIVPTE